MSLCNINCQTDHQAEQMIAIRIPGDLLCAVVARCLMVGRTLCLCSNIIIPHGETSAIVSTLNKLKDLNAVHPERALSVSVQRSSHIKTIPSLFCTFLFCLLTMKVYCQSVVNELTGVFRLTWCKVMWVNFTLWVCCWINMRLSSMHHPADSLKLRCHIMLEREGC